jgi:transposase
MGRPKGITGVKKRKWTSDQKLSIVKLHLEDRWSYSAIEKEYKLNTGTIHVWVTRYLEEGVDGFNPKPNQRNTMVSLYKKKSLTEDEALRLENFKLKVENARLKKGYQVKGVGSKKAYIPTSKMNTKLS